MKNFKHKVAKKKNRSKNSAWKKYTVCKRVNQSCNKSQIEYKAKECFSPTVKGELMLFATLC